MKKTILKSFFILSSAVILTSCGTMGIASTPTTYKNTGQEVSAEKSGINILSITPMDTHKQSGALLKELNQKCTKGVENIRTTASTKFIFIVGMEKLQMTGNCKQ